MPNRRATDWIDTRITRAVASGAQDFFSLMTGVAPVNVRRQTLVRTIIRLDFASSAIAGAWGIQTLSFGIGVTSQEAFAAGVLPDPNVPNDQPSRGWVYRNVMAVAQNGIGAQVLYPLVVDIRAMRKLDDGEMFFVLDNDVDVGTAFGITYSGMIRQLWLLP